jgi:DNA-directed RNA polymerase beta subunit
MSHDATEEYMQLLREGLPRTMTGTTIRFAYEGQGHCLRFGQIRYLPPSYANLDGTVDAVDSTDCYNRCITYNLHVCADIIHSHDVFERQTTFDDVLSLAAAPSVLDAGKWRWTQGWLRRFSASAFALVPTKAMLQNGPLGECSAGVLQARCADLDERSHELGQLAPKFNNKQVTCLFRMSSDRPGRLLAKRVTLASAVSTENCRHDPRLVVDTQVTVNSQVPVFDVPLMVGVGSRMAGFGYDREQNLPLSGSIIVNGVNNRVQSSLQQCTNLPMVGRAKKGSKWSFEVECRSRKNSQPFHSTSTLKVCVVRGTGEVVAYVPNVGSHSKTANTAPLPVSLEHMLAFLDVQTVEDAEAAIVSGSDVPLSADERAWLLARIRGFAPVATFLQEARERLGVAAGQRLAPEQTSMLVAERFLVAAGRKTPVQICRAMHRNFLPHCSTVGSKRAHFIAIVRKLARVAVAADGDDDDGGEADGGRDGGRDGADADPDAFDDRDRIRNKTVHGSGMTFGVLIRQLLRTWFTEMRTSLATSMKQRKTISAINIVSLRRYGSRINHHVNTGHFSTTDPDKKRNTLQRANQGNNTAASGMQLHDVSSTISNDNKNVHMRMMRGDGMPFICPAKTPEGKNTSLVNAKSIVTRLSRGVPLDVMQLLVSNLIERPGVAVDVRDGLPAARNVFVDAHLVGHCLDGGRFVRMFRRLRRAGVVPRCASVCSTREFGVTIRIESGRMLCPLYVADRAGEVEAVLGHMAPGENYFEALVRAGVVEFVDIHEMDECVVAESRRHIVANRHTHALLTASAMLSATVNVVPFANHNQSPRVIFFTSQHKQAMGFHTLRDASDWSSTQILSLMTPQRPLVRTMMQNVMWSQQSMPVREASGSPFVTDGIAGFSPVVAIMSGAFEVEDGIIMKREAVQRGMGAYLEVNNAKIKTPHNNSIKITRPPSSSLRQKLATRQAYRHLQANGLPRIGSYMRKGDVLLGRVFELREKAQDGTDVVMFRCHSMVATKEGTVTQVHVETNQKSRIVRIRLEKLRMPQVGDKFTNRSGQKGVIVAIMPEADMPRTMDGIVPDVLFNPHSVVSRMTMSMLLEILYGLFAAITGRSFVDGTSFQFNVPDQDFCSEHAAIEAVCAELAKRGFNPMGRHRMVDGCTGEMLDGFATVGIVHMMPLKHRSVAKAYVRPRTGPTDPRNRQPSEGREKKGGMKTGEMEREGMNAHGITLTKNELASVDKFVTHVCSSCHMTCDPPPAKMFRVSRQHRCSNCKMPTVHAVDGSFTTTAVLLPNLATLGVKTQIELTTDT